MELFSEEEREDGADREERRGEQSERARAVLSLVDLESHGAVIAVGVAVAPKVVVEPRGAVDTADGPEEVTVLVDPGAEGVVLGNMAGVLLHVVHDIEHLLVLLFDDGPAVACCEHKERKGYRRIEEQMGFHNPRLEKATTAKSARTAKTNLFICFSSGK